MSIEVTKECEGVCPNCGAFNDYTDIVKNHGECTVFYFNCESCDKNYEEIYMLTYIHTMYSVDKEKE